ncbi:peptidase S8, partial [Streptomyces asoensis]
MAHLPSRRRLALAVPVVLSLTASLGFLPTAASAAPVKASATQAADAGTLAYVVNTKANHSTIRKVKQAVAEAGGTVVATYDKIGVLVVHSANPDFGPQIRAVRGVQSAGATRTAPLSAAGTTDEGAAQVLTKAEAAKIEKASDAAGQSEPLEADQPTTPDLGKGLRLVMEVGHGGLRTS